MLTQQKKKRPFLGALYLKVEAFLQGDGPQYLGRDGARQHVEAFHVSRVGILLLPAVKHPPAEQRPQLVPGENSPLTTDGKEEDEERQREVKIQ